jgi:glycosyltransferase XagB
MSKHYQRSAATLLSRGQVILGIILMLLAVWLILDRGYMLLLQAISAGIVGFYALFVGMKLVVNWAAYRAKPYFDWLDRLPLLADGDLPSYTVYAPMYNEDQGVVSSFIDAMLALDYPQHKLQVILLADERDTVTPKTFRQLEEQGEIPQGFQCRVVPDISTFTNKPQACSYAFQFATGDLQVIFDAEDRPATDQLRKAATAFANLPERVGCLQARLAFWNPRFSRISSFYWAEYFLHFTKVLPGLAKLGLIPPLGGTSNHFRKEALQAVARYNGAWQAIDKGGNGTTFHGPWDPRNLTEDADLAARLHAVGGTVLMLNSVTFEEAPIGIKASKNQRSRWLQGFAQTFFVWLRKQLRTMLELGPIRWFFYLLLMGGTPFSVILNPITWATTATYFIAKYTGNTTVMNFIDQLFPGPVYAVGMFVAVFGNLTLWFQKLWVPTISQDASERLTDAQRAPLGIYGAQIQQDQYGLTKRMLFTPAWWAFTTLAAYRALRKMLINDYDWDKTQHGHALEQEAQLKQLTD